MAKKIYKLTVEPISCVHIGNGKELTPLDYTVRTTKNGKPLYIKFSSDRMLQRLAKDTQKMAAFERASVGGNMKELLSFFQQNCKPMDDLDYPCGVTKEFFALYEKNKAKDPYENAAIVQQMYRPAGQKAPVIPGSSLKGAVRTAILNQLMSDLSDKDYNALSDGFDNCRDDRQKARFEPNIQKELLHGYKDAKADPFRGIELADCMFDAKDTQIVGVLRNISVRKADGELDTTNSMQIQAEAIKGKLMDSYGSGTSVLRINEDLHSARSARGVAVSMALGLSDIVSSCNYFYWREFEAEYEKFYKRSVSSCDLIAKLKNELEAVSSENKNSFIIRVGHWSQVEFVTFEENFRAPKTREIKGKKLGFGGTRTVFNYDGQYLPLGWCKCTVEPM